MKVRTSSGHFVILESFLLYHFCTQMTAAEPDTVAFTDFVMPSFTASFRYIPSEDALYEALHAKFRTMTKQEFDIKVPRLCYS